MTLTEFQNIIPLDHQVKIYIPSKTKEGKRIKNRNIPHYQSAIASIFGGGTSYKAEGIWKNSAGELMQEKITVIQSYTTQEGLGNGMEKLLNLLQDMKIALNQETISLEVNNELFFL